MNPFLLTGYQGEKYFCDRIEETKTLIQSIKNGRNITLVALRRIGKTGLIKHVLNKLEKDKYDCIYIDIMPTLSLNEFVEVFGKSVSKQLSPDKTSFLDWIVSIFKSVKPNIQLDTVTGEPSISFDFRNDEEVVQTLGEIFQFIENHKRKVVIAFDEFQQINSYEEKNVEALLRSYIQHLTNVNFIYSGSSKHMLSNMFQGASRPFYQSSQMMELDFIEENEYRKFISKKFQNRIEEEAIDYVLKFTRTHTFYVQFLCNRLFELNKTIDLKIAKEISHKILVENEITYYGWRKLLTKVQWNLLTAIAKEGSVSKPTSKKFINRYKLGAASSVKTALTALVDKELVYNDNESYWVYNVFLSRWLDR